MKWNRFGIFTAMIVLSSTLVLANPVGINVVELGAKADGKTNCSAIFEKAFASGQKNIYIPAGEYLIGPKPLTIPADVFVHGDGNASVLKLAPETGAIFNLGRGNTLARLKIEGSQALKNGSVADAVFFLPSQSKNILIENIFFENCDRACIVTDHANDLVIRGCTFEKIALAISLQFSSRVKILDNTVIDARVHGIQFWGNWKYSKNGQDLIITGNYVKNGGGGGIWGTGYTRAVVGNNIVDGVEDVAIDLEWCEDSTITGNTVCNFENGGISLFFACRRITIVGNTIINNRPIKDPKASWWARAGIWLTSPNRETFKDDHGHRDVTIVGNTIFCEEGKRRAMWIGSESDNILINGNIVKGGEIWQGGKHNSDPPLEGVIKVEKQGVINKK